MTDPTPAKKAGIKFPNPLNLIPGFAALDAGLKIFAVAAAALVALGIVAAAWHFVDAPRQASIAKAQAHVAAVEATAQTSTSQAVVGVVQGRAAADAKSSQQHQENVRVFQQLPSATTVIPGADASAFAQRECMWDNERGSSACAGLQ